MPCSIPKFRESLFPAQNVPLAPEDPLYGLVQAYEADKFEKKVDLGVGAYRDDHGKPWILPVVHKAEKVMNEDANKNHEYLPIAGIPDFNDAAQRLILGAESPAIRENRACTFQTISGTGAVHLGGCLLSAFMSKPTPYIYISDPTWPIHGQCFSHVGIPVKYYPYFNEKLKSLDFEGMVLEISSAPRGSIILLHACAHNPTGVDPTAEQWNTICTVMEDKGLFPFFDCAYQGFATGSLARDNLPIRLFVDRGFDVIIAQSFAKNLGLYGQRAGALHFVSAPGPGAEELTMRVASQLSILQRSELSSPPIYGAKIAATVLNDNDLFSEWEADLRTMSGRIMAMRRRLRDELERLGTPGAWNHITDQIGMFSFTGLTEGQVEELRVKWHVYMLKNGRISVAGLNTGNVDYFARAVDDVVRRVR